MSDKKKNLSSNLENKVPYKDPLGNQKLSKKDLKELIPALLEYLKEDSINGTELTSLWSLIPKQLVIDWRDGVENFYLEKDVYSRQLIIAHEPIEKDEREARAIFLYNSFKSLLPDDQFEQLWRIAARIKEKDKEEIIKEYREKVKRNKKST